MNTKKVTITDNYGTSVTLRLRPGQYLSRYQERKVRALRGQYRTDSGYLTPAVVPVPVSGGYKWFATWVWWTLS